MSDEYGNTPNQDLNVANEDAADEAAADAYSSLGGLSAMNLKTPEDFSRAILAGSQAQQRYYDDLAKQIKERRYGPTSAEKLFALSAAFGAPTKVRGFSGTMANVLPVLQKFSELKRTGEESREEALQNLAKQRMAASQGDIKNMIALQNLQSRYGPQPLVLPPGSVVVDKRDPTKVLTTVPGTEETIVEIEGRKFIKGPKGLTPLQTQKKWRPATPEEAQQRGYERGEIDEETGEFKPYPTRKLTATEQNQIFKIEEDLTTYSTSIGSLQQALEYNNTAYEGSLSGWRKLGGQLLASDSPEYQATEMYDNLIKTAGAGGLKGMFGGNPTEGERAVYFELLASVDKPRAVREKILKRTIEELQRKAERDAKRLTGIKTGEYSSVKPQTSGKPRVINWK